MRTVKGASAKPGACVGITIDGNADTDLFDRIVDLIAKYATELEYVNSKGDVVVQDAIVYGVAVRGDEDVPMLEISDFDDKISARENYEQPRRYIPVADVLSIHVF